MMGNVLRHKEICDELNALYAKKNHDYGDSFHLSYLEEGLAMSRIRLGDKFNRFKQLSRNPDSQSVKDESIRDTLIDLANYAIMTVLELESNSDEKRPQGFTFRGERIELGHCDGIVTLESTNCTICDICCHFDNDAECEPCASCYHADGEMERFALDWNKVEVIK